MPSQYTRNSEYLDRLDGVTRNPYYVDPATTAGAPAGAAPQMILNPYVRNDSPVPLMTPEEADRRGFGLATGPSRDLGGGITATPAAMPPEMLSGGGASQGVSGTLPYPTAGLTIRGQQAVNQAAMTDQMRQRNKAAQTQWGIITEKAAKEGWTPEQILRVSEQFQTQYGYSNLPSPIALTETEEDESSPTVKLTRLKEKAPDMANFMQVTPEGKLEIIPGVVQWQANELKLREGAMAQKDNFAAERRKAVAEQYKMEAEHVRSRYGIDTLQPPGPEEDYWTSSGYQKDVQNYNDTRAKYETDMQALQEKYFGPMPNKQPAVTPQGQPATPANGRAAAAASGGVYHNSIEDTIRMVESGQIKPGTVVYYPDGRSITVPED